MKQFFYRLRQMMAMGMYGRNGQDALAWFFDVLGLIFLVLYMLLKSYLFFILFLSLCGRYSVRYDGKASEVPEAHEASGEGPQDAPLLHLRSLRTDAPGPEGKRHDRSPLSEVRRDRAEENLILVV